MIPRTLLLDNVDLLVTKDKSCVYNSSSNRKILIRYIEGVKDWTSLTELSNQELIIFIKCPDDSHHQPNYPYHISVILLENLSANRKRRNSHTAIHKPV